ncbi:MAG TPA: hypothetical protein VFK05_34080, partial [Polyangiaceae bacterium]|nr:hypothetical protein [Polyangiaceae bacterium]
MRASLSAACLGALVAVACLGMAQAHHRSVGTAAPNPPAPRQSVDRPRPSRLSETGRYVAGSPTRIAPETLPYTPQYPLWSDGASKRRWISLPKGTRIDASNPDDWQFPIGTRLWKEFSFGERTETRYLERVRDGSFRYATYVWDAALADARLAPGAGLTGAREIQPGTSHDVPSEGDCRACHEGRRSPVLGFGALQLSPDRDPLAPHREPQPQAGLDLAQLVARDLISGLPGELLARPPRIAAPTANARASAGYLFGNCAHCHNGSGPLAALGLDFDQFVGDAHGYERLRKSVVGRASRYRIPGQSQSVRVRPHEPRESALWFRMQSRFAAAQMPPL